MGVPRGPTRRRTRPPQFSLFRCLSLFLRTLVRTQTSATGRPGEHAHMRPTKLWLCIREFYVEQITIVSYDRFHYDQSHSDSCCWHPGRLRKPSRDKKHFHGSWRVQNFVRSAKARSHQKQSLVCSLRWSYLFDWMLMFQRVRACVWMWSWRTQTHPHTQTDKVLNAQC